MSADEEQSNAGEERTDHMRPGIVWVGKRGKREGLLAKGSASPEAMVATMREIMGVKNPEPEPVAPALVPPGQHLTGDTDWEPLMQLVGYELAKQLWAGEEAVTRPAAYAVSEQVFNDDDVDGFVDNLEMRLTEVTSPLVCFGGSGGSMTSFASICVALFDFGGGFAFVGFDWHEDMDWDGAWMQYTVDPADDSAVRKAAMDCYRWFDHGFQFTPYKQLGIKPPMQREDLRTTFRHLLDLRIKKQADTTAESRHEWKRLIDSDWANLADFMAEHLEGTEWPIGSPEERTALLEEYLDAVLEDRFDWY